MTGTIWIGKGGQTEMQFTMALPDNIASKDDIVWSKLMPPEDVTAWLSVDPKPISSSARLATLPW